MTIILVGFGVIAAAILTVAVVVMSRLLVLVDRLIDRISHGLALLGEVQVEQVRVAANLASAKSRADKTIGGEGAAADAASRSEVE